VGRLEIAGLNSTHREILSNDVDVYVDFADWGAKTGTLAAAFIDFLRGRERR